MIKKTNVYVVLLFFLFSCSPQRKINKTADQHDGSSDILDKMVCDTILPYRSLYIDKIAAEIFIGDEAYESRISLYYCPDSVFMLSAVNAGFEMVRIGINSDSSVYINRFDKEVFILKSRNGEQPPPVWFGDLEYLLNKQLICRDKERWKYREKDLYIDRSVRNVVREIWYSNQTLKVKGFQFYQKKTGEYIVGKWKDGDKFVISGNVVGEDSRIRRALNFWLCS